MAINLNKNRDALVAAWKEVLNEKTDTNWALFGYEGQSNDLKVVSTGSGGIEELTEDFNSGKIMYAFVKINDPKTSLDKCVLINWQGDGANTVRKGMCANHLRDVEKLFVGANLTINARNEEEVEPELIIDKIAKSGSAYSFKAPRIENVEPSKPVGTAYQRVNPTKEINSQERDRFWRKEEQEEKNRVEEERKRRDEEQSRINEESKVREARETAKREADESLRNNNIDELKNAETEKPVAAQIPIPVEETPKVNQSEVLRKQRNQEAQELISQRTIDARSIFEKNTSAGQVKKTPEKPVRASILKAQAMAQSETDQNNGLHKIVDAAPQVKPQEEPSDEEGDQFSTIKRCPKGTDRNSVTSPTSPQEEVAPSTIITEQIAVKEETVKEETVRQITEQQFVDEYIYGITNPGLKARALYDYQAADDSEITFDPGDIITNIDQVDEGWWQGLAPDGTYGLFPANYVELLQ